MNTAELDDAVEEFLDSNVADEVVETIADGAAVEESCKYFISRLLLKVLDMTTDKKRDWALDLLTLFKKPDYGLNDVERTVVPGLIQTVEELESIDLPRAPASMGVVIAECLKRKIIPPNTLNKILEPLTRDSPARAHNLILGLWKAIPDAEVPALLKQTNFNVLTWNIPDEKVPPALKQQLETPEAQLTRGEDPLKVLLLGAKSNSSILKNVDFIRSVVSKITSQVKERNEIDEAELGPVIAALAGLPSKLLQEVASQLIAAFATSPSAGVPLFALFVTHGFPKKLIHEASNDVERFYYDPKFNEWCNKSSGSKDTPASSSSGKAGKSGGKGSSKGTKRKAK